MRKDGRAADALRNIKITKYFQRDPAGSVLIETGRTKVIVSASVEQAVPRFLKGSGLGWLHAEYSLLPGATSPRELREAKRGRQGGRTQEIERMVGRALRSVMNFRALGEKSVIIDCDVVQADGGTRTASVTGGFVALCLAMDEITPADRTFPVTDCLAAVSAGILPSGEAALDLCYEEDSSAAVDMNFVMTESGALVEVQGAGEKRPFSRAELDSLIDLAAGGIDAIISYQKDVLGNRICRRIGCVK